jgi:hypothetical protein
MVAKRHAALEAVAEAAAELERALKASGIAIDEEAIETASRVEADGGFDVDPLPAQAALALAEVRTLVGTYAQEVSEDLEYATSRTCTRSAPPAPMFEINGNSGTFWVCKHRPSHRDPEL